MGQACPVSRPANAFQHAVALEGVLFTAGTLPAIVGVPIPAERDRDAEKAEAGAIGRVSVSRPRKGHLLSH
jgi:hypothetical protein